MVLQRFMLLSVLLSVHGLWAQQTGRSIVVTGIIIDSADNLPINLATVNLMDPKTGKTLFSVLTNADGKFECRMPVYDFTLRLTHIGYFPKSILVSFGGAAPENKKELGKITLSLIPRELTGVIVTAVKPVIKQDIDRITYNVQADPESKSNDALEMLRKVPLVTVDGNDVIQLKGSGNFQIFINGKPSALMTNNPSDALKSMPAATILKIEVITVPPSKYDAEGIAGIINIITLQKNEGGYTGSIFGRWNSVFGERGSVSFSLKEGKLGLNTLLGLGYQPLRSAGAESQLINFSPASNLTQTGQNINGAPFNNGQATLSYEPDSLQLLTATFDFFDRDNIRNTFRNSQYFSPPDSLVQSYTINNTGKNLVRAFDIGANYQWSFARQKDELLTLSYQYSFASNDQHNLIISSDGLNYTGSAYNQQNNASSKTQTVQLDFVKPRRAWIIEAGTKAIFRTNYSGFGGENLDKLTGLFVVDSLSSNQFAYRQDVYSIYNSYQLSQPDWIFKGGLRLEGTVVQSSFPVNQEYLNPVPNLSIQRNSKTMGSFTLGITERIQRPGIQQLNPFVDRSNPGFIVTGNPGLRPVINHIVELGYSRSDKGHLNVSLNYAIAGNTIQNVTSLISDTVSETTYLNVGKTRSAGINLSAIYPLTDQLNFNINGQLSHLWISGVYNSEFYQNQGDQGNLNTFLRYTIRQDLIVAFNVGYFSGSIFLQGKSSDYLFNSLNMIKDFFRKKASLSITVYDPFRKFNTYNSDIKTPDFLQTSSSEYFYRNIRVAFNYKFGRLNSSIKTNHRGIKNDDLIQSGSTENQ